MANQTNFADNNVILEFNSEINDLFPNMEQKLGMITKWLIDSGLKVFKNKTEVFLFHRNDTQIISLSLHGQRITPKNTMNVLGITFDTKLNWNIQTANAITKANKSLQAIKMLCKFFNGQLLLNSLLQ